MKERLRSSLAPALAVISALAGCGDSKKMIEDIRTASVASMISLGAIGDDIDHGNCRVEKSPWVRPGKSEGFDVVCQGRHEIGLRDDHLSGPDGAAWRERSAYIQPRNDFLNNVLGDTEVLDPSGKMKLTDLKLGEKVLCERDYHDGDQTIKGANVCYLYGKKGDRVAVDFDAVQREIKPSLAIFDKVFAASREKAK